MFLEALALGLSTGTYCTMYCAPVLLPFLFGAESPSCRKNAALTGIFLGSRLAMYFLLGAVLSSLGLLAGEFFNPALARKLSSAAYIFCGVTLLLNCGKKRSCCIHRKIPLLEKSGSDRLTAILAGLSVGLHICPPLWTAMFRSVCGGSPFYMVFFYAGSLPFFVPLLGIPFISGRMDFLRRIARMAQLLLAVYFIVFNGIIRLVFGYGF